MDETHIVEKRVSIPEVSDLSSSSLCPLQWDQDKKSPGLAGLKINQISRERPDMVVLQDEHPGT